MRELATADRDWFRLTAMATARALAEGRGSTIATNAPEILDACRSLARHLRATATVEEIERHDGVVDLIFSPRRRAPRP
jgi:hypothetical protein